MNALSMGRALNMRIEAWPSGYHETTVTDAGLAVLARCDAAVTEMEDRMLADLDADARARLLAALKECVHRLGAGLPDT